ncbi:MAG: N-formylglutamate amidohydrolase [Pseudomonadota bacterium]|nr:N-formylglutamate amidohydrolase [Pseudomonadota bacterium]
MIEARAPRRPLGRSLVEVIAGRGGPLLLSVPHSGCDYSPELLARARLGRTSLEALEDPLVDRLVAGAIDRGVGAIVARAPRALIDVNRSIEELHPAAIRGRSGDPPTPRARAGLGLIPTRLAGLGELWRAPIEEVDFEWRLAHVHRPYHDAVSSCLSRLTGAWSEVLLLDCHSMPFRAPGEANVVIGDRHGTSAAPWLIEAADRIARQRGFAVARNHPFAGGHVIERHGRPERGIHALQIEIDRGTYCARDGRTPGPGFDRVALLFEALSAELGDLLSRRCADAAE